MKKKIIKCIAAITAVLSFCSNVCFAEGGVTVSKIQKNDTGYSVTLSSDSSVEANIYAVKRDENNIVQLAEVKEKVKLSTGEQTVVTLDKISEFQSLYIWDSNFAPIGDVYNYTGDDNIGDDNTGDDNTGDDNTGDDNTGDDNTGDDNTGGEENVGDGIIHLAGDTATAVGINGVSIDGSIVTITAAGEYTIEGILNDGQIVVSEELSKDDQVTINLNGVSVTSSNSAAFNGANAKIELVLAEGSENVFADTAEYTGYTTTNAPKGCVYSKRDLDISGAGLLKVEGNVKNGLVSGADLCIKKDASLTVNAVNNAVKGDNSVEFTKKTGTVVINSASGDAIKTDAIDSDTGLLEQDKGCVVIKGGTITLNASSGDGIQADNRCEISGGTVNIVSGAEGIKANEVNIPSSVDDIAQTDEAGNPIYINGRVVLSGGTIDIVSGEDAIKATKEVAISGETVLKITADGIDETDNSGYDGIQVGEHDDVTSEDGLTVTRTIVVPGTVNISGGDIEIRSTSDDAINSNGDFVMSGGKLYGNSDADFIKVYDNLEITGGELDIIALCDGIQSGKALVETTSGSTVTESEYTAGNVNIFGGTFNIVTNGGNKTSVGDNDASCKGIKANTEMNISGGEFNIDSADDAIHSNYKITITGGQFELATGDDGVHADYMLTLGTENGADDDFVMNISTSYEGIEGSVINLLSGTKYVYSTDDGINAAGDYTEDGTLNESSSSGTTSNRPGGSGSFGPGWGGDDTAAHGMIYAKGGKTYVEAYGDGLDSNGSIDMTGGIIIINGPTNGGNGVFDIGDSSGSYFNVTGGTLIGAGTSDMQITVNVSGQGSFKTSSSSSSSGGGGMQRPGNSSDSSTSSGSSGSAGEAVSLATSEGNIVFIPKVNWGYMFITAPEMASGTTYSLTRLDSYTGEEILGRTVNNVFYGLVKN